MKDMEGGESSRRERTEGGIEREGGGRIQFSPVQ